MKIDRIRAPYNFVPVAPRVVFPTWANKTPFEGQVEPRDDFHPHDRPFEDGISGTLRLEVEALTPIFVRGSNDEERFFAMPDGAMAIPGTSLRGAIRNVFEIATFSKMNRVANRRYGVRDLTPGARHIYGEHMARLHEGKTIPLVNAGWLSMTDAENPDAGPDEVVATIRLCHFAKIHYSKLMKEAGVRGFTFYPGQPQRAVDKYRDWRGDLSLTVPVNTVNRPFRGCLSGYGVVGTGPIGRTGTPVFTGQPQLWREGTDDRSNKQNDFVFFDGPERSFDVTRQLLDDFEFIHSDSGQQHRATTKPNKEWEYWKGAYQSGKKVPVFFLMEEDQCTIRAFGLAMMFKLAYRYSIGEVLERSQPESASDAFDLAETVFGRVATAAAGRRRADEKPPPSLRGRISFGPAVPRVRPTEFNEPVTAVLGSPKASYYPNYVEQRGEEVGAPPDSDGDGFRYVTYQDANAKLRGWKRYRPQDAVLRPPLPPGVNQSQFTRFRPLQQGVVFAGNLRVHNLRPVELGALLWALDFGGDSEACHVLGMARSLGYGRVKLKIAKQDCRDMSGAHLDEAGLEKCRIAFAAYMEEQCQHLGVPGGWQRSRQIFELLACASPLPPGSEDGRHMLLKHPDRDVKNEFVAAKFAELALSPAGDAETWRLQAGVRGASVQRQSPITTAHAAPTAVPLQASSAPQCAGTIRRFSNNVVRVEVEGLESWAKLELDLRIFPIDRWGRLNGATLQPGRKVLVRVDRGRVVEVVPK